MTLLAGKPLKQGMLLDRGLVFGEVDAERLVVHDIGMLPLRLAAELGEGLVRLGRGVPELCGARGQYEERPRAVVAVIIDNVRG